MVGGSYSLAPLASGLSVQPVCRVAHIPHCLGEGKKGGEGEDKGKINRTTRLIERVVKMPPGGIFGLNICWLQFELISSLGINFFSCKRVYCLNFTN